LFALAIVVLFFLSLEFISYIFFANKILHASRGILMNKRLEYPGITINSYGLRGREISLEKQKTRIVSLGGSLTFGWGCVDEETYPFQLEEKLIKEGYEVEVINAAIVGHSSYHGVQILKRLIIKLKPDYLTIMFGWNDTVPYGLVPDKENTWNNPKGFILNSLDCSWFYRAFRGIMRKHIKKTIASSEENTPELRNSNAKGEATCERSRVSSEDYIHNLNMIVKLCRSNDIIPILLTPSTGIAGDDLVSETNLNRYLCLKQYVGHAKSFSEGERVYFINIFEHFERLPKEDLDLSFEARLIDFVHPNKEGHSEISNLIKSFMIKESLQERK
jgi:lysophospholipase L1-like esterase